jgi:hypothetical protein
MPWTFLEALAMVSLSPFLGLDFKAFELLPQEYF